MGRDSFDPVDFLVYKHIDLLNPYVMVSVLFIVCVVMLLIINKFAFWFQRRNFILMLICCCFLHTFILAVFRVEQWSIRIILSNIYNQYIFWLFIFLLIFVCIDWQRILKDRFLYSISMIFMIIVVVFGLLSGYQLFVTNYKIAILCTPEIELIRAVEKKKGFTSDSFLDVNQDIIGNTIFSFASVDPRLIKEGNVYKYVVKGKTLLAMLYPQYDKGNDLFYCSSNGRDYVPCLNK